MSPVRTKKKPEIQQIATAQNDITLNYIGKVLLNPDSVLSSQGGWQGIKIYEDMIFEARVASEFQKRRLAIIGKEWDIVPASDDAQDQKIADFVKDVFENFSHDRGRQSLLSGIITGFKPGEIMWEYSEGDIWVKEIKGVSPRRFAFDLDGKLRLLTYQNMIEGIELPERKFMVFTNPSDNGSPYGDGLGRSLYWPIWFKKNGVKFWAVFLDKFGQPTPWGKYPPGTTEADQTKLLDSLKAMQTDQAIITPDNMAVELLEAARASSVDSYDKWEKFWNDAITFILLGQSATTEGTPGKLGSEEARSDVRDDIIKADADLLCECENNTLIRWLVDYNFMNYSRNSLSFAKHYPKIWIKTDPPEDLEKLSRVHQVILPWLNDVPRGFIHDIYSIPIAEGGEEVLEIKKETPVPFGFSESRKQKAVQQEKISFAESEDIWIEAYLKRISPSLKKVKSAAAEEIRTYLKKQGSPPPEDEFVEALQGILGSSYKKIDSAAVTDAVADVYRNYKLTEKAIEAVVGFGGPDVRAVNFLANLDHFYLSKFLNNPDAQAATMEFLKVRFLEGGEGLFGAGDPKVWKEFSNALSQHMTDIEGYQARRIVETGVQRSRNWAHINQIHEAGIAEIEIVEPTQECPFCTAMDGKIIQVDLAFNRMEKQAAMTPEEYEEDLKANPPDLGSIEDYVDQGLLPPYHPHCRGRIIKRIADSAP
jgi:phage gp29-like protein